MKWRWQDAGGQGLSVLEHRDCLPKVQGYMGKGNKKVNKEEDCTGDRIEAGTRRGTGKELAGLNAAGGRKGREAQRGFPS